VIPHKKQWFVKRDFFQVGIKDSSEKSPECKGRNDKF
jgi:hypothetical protein